MTRWTRFCLGSRASSFLVHLSQAAIGEYERKNDGEPNEKQLLGLVSVHRCNTLWLFIAPSPPTLFTLVIPDTLRIVPKQSSSSSGSGAV